MEDLLDLYAEPHDPLHPVVCFDERPYQLVSEVRQGTPTAPGKPSRFDYEYRREGTCNLFVFLQPRVCWRHIKVTARRTKVDFAQCMKDLVDTHCPDARRIRVVLDNLSTHKPEALYEAFEPSEARRILRKLELHYTPKHGSWLNMVEIEIAVLSTQCLDRRIPTVERLAVETAAWERHRNEMRATVQWQFTTSDARAKLGRLYPSNPMR